MDPWLELAKSIHPQLGPALAGPNGVSIGESAIAAAKRVTGTSDIDQAASALEGDGNLKSELGSQIAQAIASAATVPQKIRPQQTAAGDAEDPSLKAASVEAVELAEARAAYLAAIANQRFGWVAPLLSVLIPVSFIGVVFALLFFNPTGASGQVFNIALGSLATAFATVIAFHFGSSSGSKKKDERQSLLAAEREASRSA
ncbi:hypothetical protein SAMN05880582_101489 [Rhizobium sp. RU20A]|uniref:hypothetical protein n=1 Tax=Rhizobium sp. RU20A TaxID=1907412 RepID=UPI0009560929|nr:hypothetical protein [Rhizobium sp. RU20A]SIQ03845.1 hypothetical protein SAMN05880582_101489 [Rhizobium sp. RU20A]